MRIRRILIETIKLCRLNKPLLAIPFVVTVACISSDDLPDVHIIVLNLLAAVSGFMIGNIVNGIADKEIDRLNPRTKERPMVLGTLSKKYCFYLLAFLFMILIYCTYKLNPIYVLLLPIPASLIIIYSFLKRFTWLCHVCIGLINAAVAFSSWGIFKSWLDYRGILAGALVFWWTLGFEIIYSCQDVAYDKMCHMHSIPVEFGVENAKRISDCCHLIMTGVLVLLGLTSNISIVFWFGIIIGMILILVQHILVYKRYEKIRLILNINQLFSITLMIFALADSLFYKKL